MIKRYLSATVFLSLFLVSFSPNSLEGINASTNRAIVAGGSGFVGSHLCDRLIDEGYEVICVDNLQTGNLINVDHLFKNPLFTFIQEDITSFSYTGEKIDEIYNLACPASPEKYQASPIKTLKTNFNGTLNLLELATVHGAKYFQASTSEIYGNPATHPQPESYWGHVNPIGLRSCYDEGKRVAETLCFEFHRQHHTKIKVARIFNTYGPRMSADDGRVVSNFITQSLKGRHLTIYGDGSQTRSFCYVDDLIEGIRSLMSTDNDFTGPVNLGNPVEVTILDLSKQIRELTDCQANPIFLKLPSDDPVRRKPDISLAQEKLGWKPTISLEDGLKATIDYFTKQL
jgi:UDP-glucuronate decarboxylase